MIVRENIPLASLTTFRIGGEARYVLECATESDVQEALAFIRERSVPYMVLGEGSNVLAEDEQYDGAIIRMVPGSFTLENNLLISDAGVSWNTVVDAACEKELWGLENLAGIPGSVGAAPVQNIGAYGAEVKDTIEWVEAINPATGTLVHLNTEECEFAYRDSIFKRTNYIIVRVGFKLSPEPAPRLSYADIRKVQEAGAVLETPKDIADAVRSIRAYKFPDLTKEGTAGSFFKNPIITKEAFASLTQQYPSLPAYPAGDEVKISLAWIMDHVLRMNGNRIGTVRQFERQPLVLVADMHATKKEVDALAESIVERVNEVTNVKIEREVRSTTKNFL